MDKIELIPDLSHCIETVAKNEYRKTVNRLLKGTRNEGIEERAELLRKFLETADIKKLRQESERYLTQGKKVKFIIGLEEGESYYSMQVI
ncbi:hypothetical protein ACFLTQ_02085 [Chloroflexota bacterium]